MEGKSLRDMAGNTGANKRDVKNKLDQMQRVIDQYKGHSPQQIEAELQRMLGRRDVQQMIRSGKLARFAQSVQPMLDAAQQEKLRSLLDALQGKQ